MTATTAKIAGENLPGEVYGGSRRVERPSGRAGAIRVFCRDCMGGSARDVRACPATRCALWEWRLGAYQRRNP